MNFRICLFVYFFLLIFVSFLCLGKYRVEFNGCCSLHISVCKDLGHTNKLNKNMFENKTKTSFLVQRGKLPIFY